MITETHKIPLMHHDDIKAVVLREAQRAAAAGGRFSIDTIWQNEWWLVVKITYPEEKA